MSEKMQNLYEERLGRYQAAIALEPTDRIPISSGSNYFAEVYSGNTKQEFIYDTDKWLQSEEVFARDFPETDTLRTGRVFAPIYDILGVRTYNLPGRELAENVQFQFVERVNMEASEYDLLINDPNKFLFERFLPRIFSEMNKGPERAYTAFFKAGMAQATFGAFMRNKVMHMQTNYGMPAPIMGAFLAPFDALADALRGIKEALLDARRMPDKVLAACDSLAYIMANMAIASGDPLKRYPVLVPTHKPMFMSPKQFDAIYWPSFKKTCEIIIKAGYKIRAYLEGDWSKHWHHMLELPKGSVLCDIDSQGDIFKAKAEIGHHQCIAGGIPDSLLCFGSTREIKEKVKELCEKLGPGGGYIMNGACGIPYNTKPENYRALCDAVMEYGWYDKAIKSPVKIGQPGALPVPERKPQGMITPWEVKKQELGEIKGDEGLIRKQWEMYETLAYNWIWDWTH